jgi:nucleotide-binding universal stress UspA family protein
VEVPGERLSRPQRLPTFWQWLAFKKGVPTVNAIDNVAVGFDGSSDSRAALHWAASLAATTHASLKVVHAVGLLEHAGLSGQVAPHQDVVREIAVDAGMDPSAVEWLVIDGDPCSALLRMNEEPYSVDLIVVGTRGSGEHSGSLLGSTSLELVEHSSIPVVIVPPQSSGT